MRGDLRRAGADRRCAAAARAAQAAASRFELAILDMHMPAMDGMRAGARASAPSPRWRHAAGSCSTSQPALPTATAGRRRPASTRYLHKPVRRADLLRGAASARWHERGRRRCRPRSAGAAEQRRAARPRAAGRGQPGQPGRGARHARAAGLPRSTSADNGAEAVDARARGRPSTWC
ncbi:MAG: hypothetical protein MZV65_35160 [Chromatiales bacterium]|nr:hypothetical protein [Chromatiales bacterium]